MKKLILLASVICLMLVSCSQEKTINIAGKDTIVQPYGLFNPEMKNDSVVYKLSVPDIAVSVIFSETIVVPVICVGWFIYQPIGKK